MSTGHDQHDDSYGMGKENVHQTLWVARKKLEKGHPRRLLGGHCCIVWHLELVGAVKMNFLSENHPIFPGIYVFF